MSDRTNIKADLLAKISAANPGVGIELWDGEEAVFNSAHAWPSIAVAYAGTEFGEDEEIGPVATTYARNHVFQVFVCTLHASGIEGDTQAMTIMENAEKTVAGQLIAGLGLAEIIGEELVHVHMGRFLYVQTWKINLLESH
jgi:hypothetical protein